MKQDKQLENKNSWVYRAVGASNHQPELRQEDDFYATSPSAIDDLLLVEQFSDYIWECAAGENHLANRLEEQFGKKVFKTDIVQRKSDIAILNFLSSESLLFDDEYDIITNPPYKYALEFCEQAIRLMQNKCAMLLNIRFLEGQSRYKFFQEHPMKKVWVYSQRLACAKDGDFERYKGGVTAFAWFVWEKGWHGDTTIGWIPPKGSKEL